MLDNVEKQILERITTMIWLEICDGTRIVCGILRGCWSPSVYGKVLSKHVVHYNLDGH